MMLKELFEDGYDFEYEFNKSDLVHREKANEYRNIMKISDETIKIIKSIKSEVYIVGFSELWCPDCQINLTVMDYLTKLNSNIKLRLHSREGNEEIIKQHSDDGRVKIPTFIYLNSDFEKIGSFIEVPSNVKAVENRDNQVENIVTKREYRKGNYMEQTVLDFIKDVCNSYEVNA
ncbi:MAG: thioredoxin family protein [Paraclostridium sp.]